MDTICFYLLIRTYIIPLANLFAGVDVVVDAGVDVGVDVVAAGAEIASVRRVWEAEVYGSG